MKSPARLGDSEPITSTPSTSVRSMPSRTPRRSCAPAAGVVATAATGTVSLVISRPACSWSRPAPARVGPGPLVVWSADHVSTVGDRADWFAEDTAIAWSRGPARGSVRRPGRPGTTGPAARPRYHPDRADRGRRRPGPVVLAVRGRADLGDARARGRR